MTTRGETTQPDEDIQNVTITIIIDYFKSLRLKPLLLLPVTTYTISLKNYRTTKTLVKY